MWDLALSRRLFVVLSIGFCLGVAATLFALGWSLLFALGKLFFQ